MILQVRNIKLNILFLFLLHRLYRYFDLNSTAECTAPARFTFYFNMSVHLLCQLFSDIQSQTRSAVSSRNRIIRLRKTLKQLLPALRSRGLKVGIIKHDGHDFTPDVPGTDSYRLREAGAEGVAVYSGTRYLLAEEFRLTEQDLLALFERHGYDLVLLEGFKSSGWPKIEVVRSAISDAPVSFQPLAVVGDIPGADFDLNDIPALADWIEAQMPAL